MSRSHQRAKRRAFAWRPALRRFGRTEDGATALEFGLVAVPFFALLFALIEVGLVFFANFTLENAVESAARLIRTGQAQTQGFDEEKFKEAVCGKIVALFNCANGLKIDVRKFDEFASITLPAPLDDDGKLKDNFTYQMGGGEDIVVVRAFYEWDLVAKFPGTGLGNMGNGNRLLAATAAFRNEPYENE